jgi:hypothetical protein
MHRTILRHPRTGQPIVPIGYGKRGPIWPILGAAPDGDDESKDQDDDTGDGKDGAGADDKGKGKDPKDSQDDDGSQEEHDDEGGFDANRALSKIKKLNSENRSLRERAKQSGDKDGRIKALEAENRRLKVGHRLGLPDWLIDRLKGDTEEEILADAEKLLEALDGSGKKPPSQKPKERLRGGGDPTEEPDESDPAELAAKVRRGF